MTFLDEERQPMGGAAQGGVTGMGDVFDAAMRQAWYVNNSNAKATVSEKAYDDHSDRVFAATGERLLNPWRMRFLDEFRAEHGLDASGPNAFEMYDQALEELSKKHPDKLDILRPANLAGEPVRIARDAEEAADSVSARYRGFPGTGFLANLAGGLAGSVRDPNNVMALTVGPQGGAALGLKGLVWMAAKQGAANAGVETLMQPAVAAWRTEAGLGYGAEDFARNVGMAFAFGSGADLGVRGAFRGAQALRGRVPILDRTGHVTGWETKEEALHRAAVASKVDDVAKAAAGNTEALGRLAEATGAINDPVVHSALEMARDLDATATHRPGVDPHLNAETELQGLRALLDPDNEPFPVLPETHATEPPAAAPVDRPGQEAYVGEVAAALEDGRLGVQESAALMREAPQAAASIEHSTPVLRDAAAISRLSDAAYGMVERGEASAENAATVGRLVANKGQHASVLASLERADPKTPAEARRHVAVLTREVPRPEPVHGIDDPHGVEAQAQTRQMERSLGVMRDLHEPSGKTVAREGAPLGRSLMTVKAALEAEWGRGNPVTADTVGVLSSYDAGGLGGVRDFLGSMHPARRRDLAARLAGDLGTKATDLGRRAFTDLMTARALKHAAGVLEQTGGAEHGARLKNAAKDLEKSALSQPKAGEELQPRDRFQEARGSQSAGVERVAADAALDKAQSLRAAAAAIEDWRNHVPDRKRAELARIESDIVAHEGGVGARSAIEAAYDRIAPRRQKIVDAAMARAEKNGLPPDRWREALKNSERAELASFERMLDEVMQGRMPNQLNRERLRRLYDERQKIEDLARKDRAPKLDEALRLKEQAARLERDAAGRFHGRVTVPHPEFGNVKLPVNADGTVTFFRGEKRGQQMRGLTHRMFTTDLERARDFAGRDGVIHQVDVPPERLKEAAPRASSRDDAAKVRDGQTVFTLSEDLARRARETAPEGSIEAKALDASAGEHGSEISIEAGLREADSLERMRDIIEWCKF